MTAPRALLGSFSGCLLYATFASGAQDPGPQTWTLLALIAVATVAGAAALYGNGLALRTDRLALAGVIGLAAFAAWAAIGITSSVAPDSSWADANLVAGYVLVVVIGVALGSSLPRAATQVGVALGAVFVLAALWALLGKTLPGVKDTAGLLSRLQAPLGYWNALALCCVSGLIPLLRLAVRGSLPALAGTYVLALALGLTYSRGALFALVVALAVLLWLTPERSRTLALALSVAVAVAAPIGVAGARSDLSTNFVPVDARTGDGLILLAVTVVAGALLVLWGRALRELVLPDDAGGPASGAPGRGVWQGVAAVAAVVAITFAATGGVGRAWDDFTDVDRLAPTTSPDRVLSLSGSARWSWWGEAAGAFSDKPLTGWGSGSFRVTHLLYRDIGLRVEQPHNVELQWLAENGLPGLLLAGGGLLALLAAGYRRVRRDPEGAALLAVAAAWVAQSPFEWTWDIPAATLPMLLALGVLAGRAAPPRRTPVRGPILAGVAVAAALLAISVALPGLARWQTDRALRLASGERAARAADLAARLNPLGTEALLVAADVAERRDRLADARRYVLRAVRRQPYDVESWQQLARVEFAASDRVSGLGALAHALRLDPANGFVIGQARRAYETAVDPGESATATGTPLEASQASSATP